MRILGCICPPHIPPLILCLTGWLKSSVAKVTAMRTLSFLFSLSCPLSPFHLSLSISLYSFPFTASCSSKESDSDQEPDEEVTVEIFSSILLTSTLLDVLFPLQYKRLNSIFLFSFIVVILFYIYYYLKLFNLCIILHIFN